MGVVVVSDEQKGRPRPAAQPGIWSERDILAEAEEVAHLGAWAWDIEPDRLWWSDEVYRIFGRTPQEFPATYEGFLEYVHPDDREELERQVQDALNGTAELDFVHRAVRPTGEIRHVREHGRVTRKSDETPTRALGVVQDITDEIELQRERDEAVRALAASERRHRLLAENAWDVVWTMGMDGSITYVSPSVERVRGFTPAEAAAQTIDQINTPESAARVMEYFASLYAAIGAATEPPEFRGEMEYYRKDGSIMLAELQVIPEIDDDGHVIQILGVSRDISERRRYEEELNRLAITDPLTGVWDRRHGEELFTADLLEARRYGPAMSLLMLDIDHFKTINDTHGHQVGDRVLVELCERLTANLRTSDVLARWGGEEFVIVMRHCTLADAIPLADKIRHLIADTPFDDVGTITVSIGAAELRPDDDLASWLDRADKAMYQAKAAGRNNVRQEA
jgi:diguanylate cyclase (GGDEF)-like protein/PAS domain S-box-containing protein